MKPLTKHKENKTDATTSLYSFSLSLQKINSSMKKNHLLKILTVAVVVGTVGTLQSCNKALQNLHFNLSMQTQTVTVTIPPASGTISVGPITSTYNVDSFIRANTGNQLGISNISSVEISSCVLTLSNGTATNNFGNFESCSASFFSNTNSTPYTLSIPNNPDGDYQTLALPVDSTAQLSSYLGNQFTYNLTGSLRRPTTIPLNCTITFTYSLVVQG